MRGCGVVVVGQGVVGLAAHAALLRRGVSVIGVERAAPGHELGSSHGDSRVTRRFNFENPAYTPIFDRATELWRELERAPRDIYLRTGVLEAGPPDDPMIAGTLAAADGDAEVLPPEAVARRFPAIRLPDGWVGVLQAEGGVLRADRAIARYVEAIAAHGGAVEVGRRVHTVEQAGRFVEATLEDGETIQADVAIIAAGGWTADLVAEMAPHLTLTRQLVGWFRPAAPGLFEPPRFPVFLFATDIGVVYGFPDFASAGVKIACHEAAGVLAHADEARQDASASEMAPVRRAVRTLLPRLDDTADPVKTCIYANTRDLEFVIDRRLGQPNIVFASACSGHGFKFASAVGEALADLATGEAPRFDLAPYALARFAAS